MRETKLKARVRGSQLGLLCTGVCVDHGLRIGTRLLMQSLLAGVLLLLDECHDVLDNDLH